MMSGWMADYIWGLLIGVLYASILLFSIPLYLICHENFSGVYWILFPSKYGHWQSGWLTQSILGGLPQTLLLFWDLFLNSKLNSKPIFEPQMASIQRRYCLNKEQHTKEVNKRRADFPVCPWYISSFVFHQTGIFLPNCPTGGSSSIQSGWLAGEPSWHKV